MAIGVAAMVMVTMFSLIGGMEEDMKDMAAMYSTGTVKIMHKDHWDQEKNNPLNLRIQDFQSLVADLETLPEVAAVSPRITIPTGIYKDEITYTGMAIGVDFPREEAFQKISERLLPGSRLPEPGAREAIIGAGLAQEMGVTIGDKITLTSMTMYRGINYFTFEISGLAAYPVAGLTNKMVLAPIEEVQRFLKMDDSVKEILVQMKEGFRDIQSQNLVDQVLTKQERGDLSTRYWKDLDDTYQFIVMAKMIYNIIAAIFFFLGATVIINTTMMVIYERMKEIGTLGAMGMEGGQLIRLFFVEAAIISAIGALVGAIAGTGISLFFGTVGIDLSTAMEGVDWDIPGIIYPQWSLGTTLFVYVYAVVISSLSTLIPSRKAAKIEPVEALRSY